MKADGNPVPVAALRVMILTPHESVACIVRRIETPYAGVRLTKDLNTARERQRTDQQTAVVFESSRSGLAFCVRTALLNVTHLFACLGQKKDCPSR